MREYILVFIFFSYIGSRLLIPFAYGDDNFTKLIYFHLLYVGKFKNEAGLKSYLCTIIFIHQQVFL